ncbi:MAG: hypothetical protein ACK5NF_00920 [Bacilli bacterium]
MYKGFSLYNVLCSVMNNSNYSSIDYNIANYLIENFSRLSELNIYDISSDCHCTRQSVRRFCKKIGFTNFVSLKKYNVTYYYTRWEHTNRFNVDNFQMDLRNRVISTFDEIDGKIELGELNELSNLIFSKNKIIFIVDETIKSLIFQFQKVMFYHHKIVKIISNSLSGDTLLKVLFEGEKDEQDKILKLIDKDDLIVTISLSGNFSKAIEGSLSKIEAQKVLISNSMEDSSDNYDYAFSLVQEGLERSGVNEYTVFGLNYYLENLLNIYSHAHGSVEALYDMRDFDKEDNKDKNKL